MFDAPVCEKCPFDIFSFGGDMSDANVVKFNNDGRLMLLTTTDGHIHVLDSFCGMHLSTYNVKPVSSNATLEASFSPEGCLLCQVQVMAVSMLGVFGAGKKYDNDNSLFPFINIV